MCTCNDEPLTDKEMVFRVVQLCATYTFILLVGLLAVSIH
jgi:hypothetical protein